MQMEGIEEVQGKLPYKGKKRGRKKGSGAPLNFLIEDWYHACQTFENLKDKMKQKEFLRSNLSHASLTACTPSQAQSFGRMLKKYRAGNLSALKLKRERPRKYLALELKLIQYVNEKAKRNKQDKCGVSWALLREKSLFWAENMGLESFKASSGWVDKTLKRHGIERNPNHNQGGNTNSVVEDFFTVSPSSSNDSSSSSAEDDHVCHERLQDEIHSLAIQKHTTTAEEATATAAGVYDDLKSFLVETRRRLHRHPELMYQEKQTSATIQSILTELNIDFTTGWSKNTHEDVIPGPGGYGIVANIGTSSSSSSDSSSPCILLRADMDALPILEVSEQQFVSEEEGKMHACGHDAHTTMLLGAAAILKQMEHSLPGNVRLMFQPAEEGGAGAKRMVEEGVLTQSPPVSHAYAMHVWPTLPSGVIAAKPGALMAAADTFEITLLGKGGHAAMPHLTIDPIVATSALVLNLQTIVSRNMSPLESGVVSITQIKAGQDVYNVIPASSILKGTIRALSTDTLSYLRTKVEEMVHSTASLYHCSATIVYSPDFYPPTINDPTLFEFSKTVAALVSKEGFVRDDIEPTMGGEDFAFVAQAVPSTFFFLGQGGSNNTTDNETTPQKKQLRTNYGLHHPQFALDEDIMPQGVELHVTLALRTMKKLLSETKETTTTTK